MPEFHPAGETLLEHAAGRLSRHLRPIVEAHLELCPRCQEEFSALAAPGGEALREIAPERPALGLWERLASRLDEPEPKRSLPREAPLPAAARAELPAKVQSRWGGLFARGAEFLVLDRDEQAQSMLCLAHMPGGRVFPRHAHLGFEHSVVLSGGYADETGQFEVGDFGVYPPGSEHGPNTLEGEDCWILFAIEKPVRFAGWRGVLQRLFGA